jgi:hypothetical protein
MLDLHMPTVLVPRRSGETSIAVWADADIDPGNPMPAFEGIVAEEEYASLIANIRSLQIDK